MKRILTIYHFSVALALLMCLGSHAVFSQKEKPKKWEKIKVNVNQDTDTGSEAKSDTLKGKEEPPIKDAKADSVKAAKKQYFGDEDYDLGNAINPSPREGAASWQDEAGNIWVFGGVGYDEDATFGLFDDLWRYDTRSNFWIHIVKTDSTTNKEWKSEKQQRKTTEIPDLTLSTRPPARAFATTWVDKKGNFWLYGGQGISEKHLLNDTWFYDPKKDSWTIVGKKSKFSEKALIKAEEKGRAENPGGRIGSITWADKNNNFYLFGGYGTNGNNGSELLNDLWILDTKKNIWELIDLVEKKVKKEDNENKGKEKEAVSFIKPSPRTGAVSWHVEQESKVYIYGGFGQSLERENSGNLADLWSYDYKRNEWELLSPTLTQNKEPVFADVSTYNEFNHPGWRYESSSWQQDGDLYLFGGHGRVSGDVISVDRYVWAYNIEKQAWRILIINDAPALFTKTAFTDSEGAVYFFGGNELNVNAWRKNRTNAVYKLNLKP